MYLPDHICIICLRYMCAGVDADLLLRRPRAHAGMSALYICLIVTLIHLPYMSAGARDREGRLCVHVRAGVHDADVRVRWPCRRNQVRRMCLPYVSALYVCGGRC